MKAKTKATATNEGATPALVPKLRFPEFRVSGDWTTETLGSLAHISTEKVGNKAAIPMSITSGVGLMSQMDKFGRIIAGRSYPNYLLLRKDDFAYNKSATKEFPEGFIALYSGDELAAVPNSIFTCFRIKGESPVPQYLNHLFLRNLHGRWLRKFIEVGARAHGSLSINEADLLALPVPLPSGKESVAEQQKIAECLSSVDEVIAAQARKVDALKTHKKGLMQQLFPREGETRPRLRFPEFRNDGGWSESKLIGLSSESLSNGVFNDPKKVGSGYKLVNVSDMYIETTIDESRLSLLELSRSDFEANQVIAGDIFFTRSSLVKSGIAVSNIYIGSSNDVTYDGHLIRFRPNRNKVVPLFAHYLFKAEPIRSQLIARGKTATMTTIGQADVASVMLFYPDKAEQHRIASCLSSLDALIAAETQKHAALQRHKRGLMQQLFPSPAEDMK